MRVWARSAACCSLRAAAPSAARRRRPKGPAPRWRRSRPGSFRPDCAVRQARGWPATDCVRSPAQSHGGQPVQFALVQHRARFGQPRLRLADVQVALQRQRDQPVQLRVLQLLPPVALHPVGGEQGLLGAGQGDGIGPGRPVVGPHGAARGGQRRQQRDGAAAQPCAERKIRGRVFHDDSFGQAAASSACASASSRARGVSLAARWSRANTV